jgi:hypothetical protein
MNALRNKLGHNIEFKVRTDDLAPLSQYLVKVYEGRQEVPTEPKTILEAFTTMTCVLFAGMISGMAQRLTTGLQPG